MPTIFTFHPGKAEMQISAVQIPMHHLHHVRTVKPVAPFKPFFIDLLENFKTILNTLIIYRIIRISRPVNSTCRHRSSQPKKDALNVIFD